MKGLMALPAVALLAGCSMVPHYVRPAAPVPATFADAGEAGDAALPGLSYRDIFRDARLQKLIEQALNNNRDLQIAAANIAAARAQFGIVRAEQLPAIGTTVSATESDSGTGRTNAGGSPVLGGARTNYNISSAITSFELDVFGRVRALGEAQQARLFATQAVARATRLTLIGDIAAAWLRYAADKSLADIAVRTMVSADNSVELARIRLEGGIDSLVEMAQARTILATAQADLALQKTAIAQDENALRLLVGAQIDPALLPASIEQAAPGIAVPPVELDSAILLRRPDIVAAEYQLRAANAQVGAARAALFPRLSLTTVAGLASNGLSRLFTGNAFNYSATPGISYPLFSGGAGKAGVAQARALFDAARAAYEKAIQTGFREVADALARRATIAQQRTAQEALLAAATENLRLTDLRYRGGIGTHPQWLDAERTRNAAQRGLVDAQLTEAANLVTLYRTLGGDALIDAPGGAAKPEPAERQTTPQ